MENKLNYIGIGAVAVMLTAIVLFGYFSTKNSENTHKSAIPTSSDNLNLIAPITKRDQSKGNKEANIVIVDYSDFQCPACAYTALKLLPEIEDYYQGKIKIVFRHFPLSYHKISYQGSLAAEAAGKQGKFWVMHDMIFENQNTLDKNAFNLFAKKIGLDYKKFKSDMKSEEIKNKVNKDIESGEELKIRATPTLFINGEKYSGELTFDALRFQIDSLLNE